MSQRKRLKRATEWTGTGQVSQAQFSERRFEWDGDAQERWRQWRTRQPLGARYVVTITPLPARRRKGEGTDGGT